MEIVMKVLILIKSHVQHPKRIFEYLCNLCGNIQNQIQFTTEDTLPLVTSTDFSCRLLQACIESFAKVANWCHKKLEV